MKANQSFRNADEAVSPVIGVILMVAITVVLAAVVFVLVTKLSGNQKTNAPSLSVTRSESNDRLNVVSSDNGLNYGMFRIVADKNIGFLLNGQADETDSGANAGVQTNLGGSGNPVAAGNFISLCSADGAVVTQMSAPAAGTIAADDSMDANTINVKIVHVETNEQVFETTFATLETCDTV